MAIGPSTSTSSDSPATSSPARSPQRSGVRRTTALFRVPDITFIARDADGVVTTLEIGDLDAQIGASFMFYRRRSARSPWLRRR